MKVIHHSIIFLVLLLFSIYTIAQNPISVTYDLKEYKVQELSYVVLDITYENKSDEDLFLWIQDWRVIALDTLMDSIQYFPDPEVLFNGLIINANQRQVKDQIVKIVDGGGYNPATNCYTVKHLNARDNFLIKMTFTNSRVVNIVKNESFELIGKVNYIKANYFNSVNEDILFHNYPEDSLDILVPVDHNKENYYFNVQNRPPNKVNDMLSKNSPFYTNKMRGDWIEFIKRE